MTDAILLSIFDEHGNEVISMQMEPHRDEVQFYLPQTVEIRVSSIKMERIEMKHEHHDSIQYGTEDVLPPGVKYNSRDVKVNISSYLDGDVLEALKKRAKFDGQDYKAMINEILRAYFF